MRAVRCACVGARGSLFVVLSVAACGRSPTTSPARCPTAATVVVPTARTVTPSTSSQDTSKATSEAVLSDGLLEEWLRGGCGPIETGAEQSSLATIDAKLAQLKAPAAAAGGAGGTIVHARGSELWLVSADGLRRRRVKGASPQDDRPRASWSPSGDALAFVTQHGDERGRAVVLSPTCEWARVVGRAGTWQTPSFSPEGRFLFVAEHAIHLLSGTSMTPPPYPGRYLDWGEDLWLRVKDEGGGRINVAKPKWSGVEAERAWPSSLTPDGRTPYAFLRFRTSSEAVVGGEKTTVLTDYSPIYRVNLPAKLPQTPTKPLAMQYFAPGFTPIRGGWLSVSPSGKYLFAVGESYILEGQPLADAQWIHTATAKTTSLGSTHRLIGARSWINDALWSPDGSRVLLTVAACAGEMSVNEPFCSDIRHELVVADEKAAAFVAVGSRASWTPTAVLTKGGGP